MTTPSANVRATTILSDGSRLDLTWHASEKRDNAREAPDLSAALELARAQVERDHERGQEPVHPRKVAPALIGESAPMQQIMRMIEKVAPTGCTVLITGENGTGKELVAQAIHRASPRAHKPFVAANCSAFNDNLLESELFGHRRGSFTGAHGDKRGLFEEADTGTFLLDEVGDMTPALQVKLLRVLQEGTFLPVGGTQTKKVDVRIVAATNKDLGAMVKAGTFREDLYYRLHVVALRTPPLRDRGADIDVLIAHFMQRLSARHAAKKTLSEATLRKLRAHRWPGNVRELQNEIERLWVLSGPESEITPEHLSRAIYNACTVAAAPASTAPSHETELVPEGETLSVALERFERGVIERALERAQNNRTRAALALGVSRRNLIRKLQALGLSGQEDLDAVE